MIAQEILSSNKRAFVSVVLKLPGERLKQSVFNIEYFILKNFNNFKVYTFKSQMKLQLFTALYKYKVSINTPAKIITIL